MHIFRVNWLFTYICVFLLSLCLRSTYAAVQHERKPLLEKKEHSSIGNANLHNANDTNSNNASGAKFNTNNISNLSNILPAHIFANFTSNLAQQGKMRTFFMIFFGIFLLYTVQPPHLKWKVSHTKKTRFFLSNSSVRFTS